jgi:hypothetical protein
MPFAFSKAFTRTKSWGKTSKSTLEERLGPLDAESKQS